MRNSKTGLIALMLLAGTVGCLVHRPADSVEPAVSAAAEYRQEPRPAGDLTAFGRPWWESFEDPELNALMDTALAVNLELRQVALRIEQADALVRQAGARLLPSLFGTADYDSIWRDLDDSESTTREESASAGALLNWEVDVWGRLRSAKGARASEREATYEDWLGARLLLSAVLAETYFEILEQREQLRLLQSQIEVNQTLLELNQLRFGQGLSSIVDVLQQQEQLDNTYALVPEVEARAGQLENALAVLLAQPPGAVSIGFRSLPAGPSPFRDTGVPSDLLLDRPDLMAEQHRITALDYRVGEAIADRLPRFEIGGALSAVGDPSFTSLVGNAFGSLTAPLFTAGERKAEVDFRRAELQAALAGFSNSYLAAVRDVETALLRERKQAEQLTLQERQLNTATRLFTETRNQYSQGLTDYLPVLAAIATEQNLRRELITSRRELLTRRIALHRALGGPMSAAPELASLEHE